MLKCFALALGYNIASKVKLAINKFCSKVPYSEALSNNG